MAYTNYNGILRDSPGSLALENKGLSEPYNPFSTNSATKQGAYVPPAAKMSVIPKYLARPTTAGLASSSAVVPKWGNSTGQTSFAPSNTDALESYFGENGPGLGPDPLKGGGGEGGLSGLLGDEHMMGNLTGLAGTVMQAMALPQMLKNAKLQNKSLQFNLDTAKAEQARRNKNISSFNNVNTSAFV